MTNLAHWLQPCLRQVQVLKQTNRLSHALLITGADGVGQEELAREIVKDLMCEVDQAAACGHCHSCQLMQADTHPDFRVLDGQASTIKVDQIRLLVRQISQKPQVGQNKVVLMTHAQAMNINAANAVLKALEEPAARTYFILTSSQSTSLLPTIRSRCLLVNVPTPSLPDVKQWLMQQPDGQALSSLFWLTTQPFRLLSIQQQGKVSLYAELPNQLTTMLQGSVPVSEVLKGLESNNIEDYCNGFAAILHQCICHSAGAPLDEALQDIYSALMARLGIQTLMLRYQSLQKLKSDLKKTNLNPIMQLTHELNQW
ncbi:DNA polymerase III subunit delta' [Marinomonas sp. M1K-6]|uniref:DNA-directed DNA polymerase n=1 Tax=Marinomonas profundi TaxID=2726122 RepID=A0A847R6A5_9GAMM|nr:DNA polymerase III subunit delta' [Marinomonas profundi]NLQ16434.1 DNA polymerase III subunit delta' [Marinomonas profundi]UDV02993.1 DNA polymerase III subunit delta' [Marinomonas profundi]